MFCFVASHGSAVLTFAVGGQEIRHSFSVADLVAPTILGLDFLKANHAFVDICGADIWINGQRIGCFPQRSITLRSKIAAIHYPVLTTRLTPSLCPNGFKR